MKKINSSECTCESAYAISNAAVTEAKSIVSSIISCKFTDTDRSGKSKFQELPMGHAHFARKYMDQEFLVQQLE
jgi:hypothetical protein